MGAGTAPGFLAMRFQIWYPVLERSELICSYGRDVSLAAGHRYRGGKLAGHITAPATLALLRPGHHKHSDTQYTEPFP